MREDIQKYLGTVQQSTAKTIADRIGVDRLDVARELNHMLSDGLVEREKRQGGGNEYVYWLARGDVKQAQDAAVKPEEERSLPAAAPEAFDLPEFREVDRPLSELYALIGVDLSITDIPVWHAIEMVRGLKAIGEAGLQAKAVSDSRIAALESELANARAEVEAQAVVIAKLKENTAALEQTIDDLTGVADVQLPKVYVTVGRYAKPKRHADLPRAQRRAAALVRNEKESEVLVLAPVGRMVRGSEWRSQ
ncbi:1-pyrroline-5-carboxylate dehydrogenase [Paraburkholderia xenovorans]|uniref:1-pyrroline-5-carboxylate dehydrogenase n=1 Tax=Paraburkholderia xenovorans TaxID=36873 RepID=UPI0038BD5281